MNCNVQPYMGKEPKAAMVHAYDDDGIVYPFIERLSRSGLRIWHDAEIRKVMVDYSRNWKLQQSECSCFLIFLTENAVNSHIFRERFTSIVEKEKPFIVISVIGQDQLSPGMQLQVNKAIKTVQSSYIPQESLAEELAAVEALRACKGNPNPNVVISEFPQKKDGSLKADAPAGRDFLPTERTILEMESRMPKAAPAIQAVPPAPETAAIEPALCEDAAITPMPQENAVSEPMSNDLGASNRPELDATIKLQDKPLFNDDLESTYIPRKISLPVLVSFSSAEKAKGMLGEATVGRAKKMQGPMADISFTDQCKLFSGRHFQLIYIDDLCMLVCKHPNGMNVNDVELKEGDKYTVESEAVIQIPSNATLSQVQDANIRPTYIAIASGSKAQALWEAPALAFLQSRETGELRCFVNFFKFGRSNAWKTDVLISRNISRDHGDIVLEGDHFRFADHSTNGTFINGEKVNNQSADLSDGDIISVQGNDQDKEEFVFHCCFFERS